MHNDAIEELKYYEGAESAEQPAADYFIPMCENDDADCSSARLSFFTEKFVQLFPTIHPNVSTISPDGSSNETFVTCQQPYHESPPSTDETAISAEGERECVELPVLYQLSPMTYARRMSGAFEEPERRSPGRPSGAAQFKQEKSFQTPGSQFPDLLEFKIVSSQPSSSQKKKQLQTTGALRQSLSRSITALTNNRDASSPMGLMTRMSTAWDLDGAAAAASSGSKAPPPNFDCTPYASLADEETRYGSLDTPSGPAGPHLAVPNVGSGTNSPGRRLVAPEGGRLTTSSGISTATSLTQPSLRPQRVVVNTGDTYFSEALNKHRPVAPKPPEKTTTPAAKSPARTVRVTAPGDTARVKVQTPADFPDEKRRINDDYPIAPWLIQKKVFPETYRCPYTYAKTVKGKYGVINYDVAGDYKGEVTVCFHGLNATRLTYEEVQSVLSRYGYCILSFDLYGHGLSANPPYRNCCAPCFCHCSATSTYSAKFYVKQANELISLLGMQDARFTVIGFSMGGVVGAQFALNRINQVDRVILLSTAGMIGFTPLAVRGLRCCRCCISALPFCICHRCCSANQFAKAKNAFIKKFTPEEVRAGVAEALWQRMVWQLFVKKGVLDGFLGSVANVPLWGSKGTFQELGRTGIPVLLLWGKDDVVAPASCATHVKSCFPNSHLIMFNDCSHLLLNDQLQSATALILTFQDFPKWANMPTWRWLLPFTPDGVYVPRENRCPEGKTLKGFLEELKFKPRLFVRLPRGDETR